VQQRAQGPVQQQVTAQQLVTVQQRALVPSLRQELERQSGPGWRPQPVREQQRAQPLLALAHVHRCNQARPHA
jgi:hypothetical protein